MLVSYLTNPNFLLSESITHCARLCLFEAR
jgi:hypothetical protein